MKGLEEMRLRIQNFMYGNICEKDLFTICQIFDVQLNPASLIRQRILERVLNSSDHNVLSQILYILMRAQTPIINENPIRNNQLTYNGIVNTSYKESYENMPQYNPSLYFLTNETIKSCPIDIKKEIPPDVDCKLLFNQNFTKYSGTTMSVPSATPSYGGRVALKNIQIPFITPITVINPSPFYCGQVILHPMSLLIPKPSPDVSQHQNNRVMSKIQVQFILTHQVQNILINQRHYLPLHDRFNYKWQVVMRFGAYNSQKTFPDYQGPNKTELPECLPPYLSIWVNNTSVSLWDILPSNSIVKEGKRHPRPANISDFLKFSTSNDQGVRQYININWWQTPGVYQYYYFGIFLERKVSVNEYLERFQKNLHPTIKTPAYTLKMINEKFSSNSQFTAKEDADDDIVMSSVLPVSLQCPVGKTRIECPVRSINCQHLQCFDAHLYLLMNERRCVWKCPVCDAPASINDLFVDEYFCKILKECQNDEDATEVNINSDGSYTVVIDRSGDCLDNDEDCYESNVVKHEITNSNINGHSNEKINQTNDASTNNKESVANYDVQSTVILLDSDSDDERGMDSMDSPEINNVHNKTPITEIIKPASVQKSILAPTIDLTSDTDDIDYEQEVPYSIPSIPPSITMTTSTLSTHISTNTDYITKISNIASTVISPSISPKPTPVQIPSTPKECVTPPLIIHPSQWKHILPSYSVDSKPNMEKLLQPQSLQMRQSQIYPSSQNHHQMIVPSHNNIIPISNNTPSISNNMLQNNLIFSQSRNRSQLINSNSRPIYPRIQPVNTSINLPRSNTLLQESLKHLSNPSIHISNAQNNNIHQSMLGSLPISNSNINNNNPNSLKNIMFMPSSSTIPTSIVNNSFINNINNNRIINPILNGTNIRPVVSSKMKPIAPYQSNMMISSSAYLNQLNQMSSIISNKKLLLPNKSFTQTTLSFNHKASLKTKRSALVGSIGLSSVTDTEMSDTSSNIERRRSSRIRNRSKPVVYREPSLSEESETEDLLPVNRKRNRLQISSSTSSSSVNINPSNNIIDNCSDSDFESSSKTSKRRRLNTIADKVCNNLLKSKNSKCVVANIDNGCDSTVPIQLNYDRNIDENHINHVLNQPQPIVVLKKLEDDPEALTFLNRLSATNTNQIIATLSPKTALSIYTSLSNQCSTQSSVSASSTSSMDTGVPELSCTIIDTFKIKITPKQPSKKKNKNHHNNISSNNS